MQGRRRRGACTWSKLPTGTNLALRYQSRGMLNGERCEYRYASLGDAKSACERERAWCGGIARDVGLDCGHGKYQFELRLNSSMADSPGAATWLHWCGFTPVPARPPRYEPPPIVVPPWDTVAKTAPCVGRCPRLRDIFFAIMTSRRSCTARAPLRTMLVAAHQLIGLNQVLIVRIQVPRYTLSADQANIRECAPPHALYILLGCRRPHSPRRPRRGDHIPTGDAR